MSSVGCDGGGGVVMSLCVCVVECVVCRGSRSGGVRWRCGCVECMLVSRLDGDVTIGGHVMCRGVRCF